MLQGELDGTKSQAQYLLMSQGEEINSSATAAAHLEERLSSLLSVLNDKMAQVLVLKCYQCIYAHV